MVHVWKQFRARAVSTAFVAIRGALVVIVAATVVYWPWTTTVATAQSDKTPKAGVAAGAAGAKPGVGADTLPNPVAEMRDAILAAARSGRIEEMKIAIDLNELKPEFDAAPVPDPIAFWRKLSGDGEGREVLADAINILAMPFAVVPLGKDVENNRIFVWPYLAEIPLDKLTSPQEVDLLRLVSPDDAKAMKDKKKYTGWRITIGADGTWHSFRKAE